MDKIEEDGVLNPEEGDERRRLKIQYEKLLREEEIKWKQKTKFRWFKEVDGNTKFFHKMTNARHIKNQVSKILWNGVIHEDPPELIESSFSQYFTSLYSSPPNTCRRMKGLVWESISSFEAEMLEKNFTEEEIYRAIVEMDGDKSSNSDGFTMTFFKSCWDVIKNDLMLVFTEFYKRGIISMSMNSTFIALIPKKDGIFSPKDF